MSKKRLLVIADPRYQITHPDVLGDWGRVLDGLVETGGLAEWSRVDGVEKMPSSPDAAEASMGDLIVAVMGEGEADLERVGRALPKETVVVELSLDLPGKTVRKLVQAAIGKSLCQEPGKEMAVIEGDENAGK